LVYTYIYRYSGMNIMTLEYLSHWIDDFDLFLFIWSDNLPFIYLGDYRLYTWPSQLMTKKVKVSLLKLEAKKALHGTNSCNFPEY